MRAIIAFPNSVRSVTPAMWNLCPKMHHSVAHNLLPWIFSISAPYDGYPLKQTDGFQTIKCRYLSFRNHKNDQNFTSKSRNQMMNREIISSSCIWIDCTQTLYGVCTFSLLTESGIGHFLCSFRVVFTMWQKWETLDMLRCQSRSCKFFACKLIQFSDKRKVLWFRIDSEVW